MECKYCDTGFPANYNGDIVCGGCGAEWADAAISSEEYED